MPDNVHMLISIHPKYSVAQMIGFIKGALFISPGPMWVVERILQDSIFGPGDILYPQWVGTRKRSGMFAFTLI